MWPLSYCYSHYCLIVFLIIISNCLSRPIDGARDDTISTHTSSTIRTQRKKNKLKKDMITINNDSLVQQQQQQQQHDQVEIIGGGTINEKKRYFSHDASSKPKSIISITKNNSNDDDLIQQRPLSNSNYTTNFNPQTNISHLLHALVGLDRYPNYISRWNYNLLQDVNSLEDALKEQLVKVQNQKQILLERNERVNNLIDEVKKLYWRNDNGDDNDDYDGDWDILNPPQDWNDVQNNILHPKCSKAIFQSKMFRKHNTPPNLNDVLHGNIVIELDEAQCEEWLDQEMFDVYSFPLLSKSFCEKVKRVMKRLTDYQQQQQQQQQQQHKQHQEGHDSTLTTQLKIGNEGNKDSDDDNNEDKEKVVNALILGARPIDMDMIGLSWLNNLLFHLIIRPLSRHLFQKDESLDDLDWRQGYIVGYSKSASEKHGIQRQRLVPHTDDSEVTLNVGMGDEDFEGGELSFWGLRNTDSEGTLVGEFHPAMGTALIHAGRHLHEVKSVTKGNRFAYIIWARSWKGVRSLTCPCCWLNRRQGMSQSGKSIRNSCICGLGWN